MKKRIQESALRVLSWVASRAKVQPLATGIFVGGVAGATLALLLLNVMHWLTALVITGLMAFVCAGAMAERIKR